MLNPSIRSLRHALVLGSAWLVAAAAYAAGGTVYWIAPHSNIVMDRQVTADLGKDAGLIIIRANWEHPDVNYTLAGIARKFKETSTVPVLAYGWASRFATNGRSEVDMFRGLDIGNPVAELNDKGVGTVDFLDVTNPDVRRRIVSRFVEAKKNLGVDGFAIDLATRTPVKRPGPLAQRCRRESNFCPDYARGMDAVFEDLRRSLGDSTYIAFNGLWNFNPGMIADQSRLLKSANAAAIEYFGMDPNEKRHSFREDILPYLQAVQGLPRDRAVLFFARGPWQYVDYLEDYHWQRYLYASFLLAARDNDMFKYHASFQIPAHQGRSGGLDHYADWRMKLGGAEGPMTASGGLYTRQFADGLVVVAPDDGPGGSIRLPHPYTTPEGLRREGTLRLAPGTGMILLEKPRAEIHRQPQHAIGAQAMDGWKWSGASMVDDGSGRKVLKLSPLPPAMTGEHDVELDSERSLTPYQRLEIDAKLLDGSSSILAVAEVDDRKREYDTVVVEVAAGGGSRQVRLDSAVPFRSIVERGREAQWPVVSAGAPPSNGPIVLDGNRVFEGTGFTFRRWSHVRFNGAVTVARVIASEPAPATDLDGGR